jgi:hypothetical protein
MQSFKYTIDIVPVGDHLQVTVPEIGFTGETVGTRRTEAEDVASRAVVDHLLQKRQKRPIRKRASALRQSA